MTDVVLLSDTGDSAELILPALSLLRRTVQRGGENSPSVEASTAAHVVLVDGRDDLVRARSLCRATRTSSANHAIVVVVTEGGLAGVSADWQLDDVLVTTATPAEVDMRLRLALARISREDSTGDLPVIEHGAVRIDPITRIATVGGNEMALTYLEFELLVCLAQHPGRVFRRGELLARLWGNDYAGGPRTIDVHVRRLRIALGEQHAHHIGTIRRVGYTFTPQPARTPFDTARSRPADAHRRAAGLTDRHGVFSAASPHSESSRGRGLGLASMGS